MRVSEAIESTLAGLPIDDPGEAGGLVTVLRGHELESRAFGLVNLEYGLPWRAPDDADRPFRMGSIAKHFTAVAMVILDHEGQLALDDDVRAHLPELPDRGVPIRLRQLLDQTSGLVDEEVAWRMAGATQLDVLSNDQRFQLQTRLSPLNSAPGTESLYVSAGTHLCSTVIRRVTGSDLAVYLDERVFLPLGMRSTFFSPSFHDVVPHAPGEYVRSARGSYRFHRHGGEQAGDGALVSTTNDLLRWNDNLRSDALGVPHLVSALTARPRLADGRMPDYGLGTIVRDVGGRSVWFHAGSNGTQKSIFLREPTTDTCVIVQLNRSDLDHHRIGHALMERLLDAPPMTTPDPMPDALLGTYGDRQTGLVFHLAANDPAHVHQGAAQLRFTSATSVLVPESPSSWISSSRQNFSVRVRATDDGLVVELGDRTLLVERAQTTADRALAADHADLLGCYRSAALEHVVQVLAGPDGTLRLRFGPVSAQQRLLMRPIIADVFDCEIEADGGALATYDTGWHLCSVAVRRNEAGDVRAIVLSHAVCRGIEFERVG
jgi:CubicO group peptidase (beta-lactamase class C family)